MELLSADGGTEDLLYSLKNVLSSLIGVADLEWLSCKLWS